jgi:predicted flap endonuclease-1-like 5' DNA nuclease
MFYDLATFSLWLLVALLIGMGVGWSTYSDSPREGWLAGWIKWAVLAFVVGLIVAMLKLLPGRIGFWLEVALLMTFAYTVGCFLGGWLKSWFSSEETTSFASATTSAGSYAVAGRQSGSEAEAGREEAAEAERRAAEAAAKAEAERLAAEAAAKAEGERVAVEAAAKAEAERLAAEAAAKAEAERVAAEAAAKAEAERLAAEAATKAEAERLAAEVAAKAEAERVAAEAEAERLAADAASKAEAERETAAVYPGVKPSTLAAPNDAADDLKLIKGIGPKNERILNTFGVYHFTQIADWSPENAVWMGHHMAFPGRIEREHWISQAKLLAAGLDTEHSAAVKSGAITIDDSADAPLGETEAKALAESLPATMPRVEGEEKHSGSRPLGLAVPRGGTPDDLKLIKGIGKQNEARLHGLGVWHFDQIAAWSPENVKWVGSYLSFSGRIDREKWIAQAKDLAAGQKTEFARRVEAGLVKSSRDDGSHGQNNFERVEPKLD